MTTTNRTSIDVLTSVHHEHSPNRPINNTSPFPTSPSVSDDKVLPTFYSDSSERMSLLDGKHTDGKHCQDQGSCEDGHPGPPPSKRQRMTTNRERTGGTATETIPSLAPTATTTTTTDANDADVQSIVPGTSRPSILRKQRSPEGPRRRRHVNWDDDENQTFEQEDPRSSFQDYNETDIWYTRDEYDQFLMDRIRTVECLQANGNNTIGDTRISRSSSSSSFHVSDVYCMRGLEPFQDSLTHRDMSCKRKLHKSTVMVEQVRQALLGVYDPERFRLLVAPQSELALHRARELAALDETEVDQHRTITNRSGETNGGRRRCPPPRRSSMSAVPTTASLPMASSCVDSHADDGYKRNVTTESLYSNSMAGDLSPMAFSSALSSLQSVTPVSAPSLFSERIRQLQEKNARRLMEIYNPSSVCGGKPGETSNSNGNHHLFRFSLRRDSLSGGTMGSTSGMTSIAAVGPNNIASHGEVGASTAKNERKQLDVMKVSRFPLRRDSLSHLGGPDW